MRTAMPPLSVPTRSRLESRRRAWARAAAAGTRLLVTHFTTIQVAGRLVPQLAERGTDVSVPSLPTSMLVLVLCWLASAFTMCLTILTGRPGSSINGDGWWSEFVRFDKESAPLHCKGRYDADRRRQFGTRGSDSSSSGSNSASSSGSSSSSSGSDSNRIWQPILTRHALGCRTIVMIVLRVLQGSYWSVVPHSICVGDSRTWLTVGNLFPCFADTMSSAVLSVFRVALRLSCGMASLITSRNSRCSPRLGLCMAHSTTIIFVLSELQSCERRRAESFATTAFVSLSLALQRPLLTERAHRRTFPSTAH